MHVKVGNAFQVIAGDEERKKEEIAKIFRNDRTVVLKDLNLKTKHMKRREEGEPCQIRKVVFF